ncbi:MAG: gamma-glutamylcyclotransferase family protein [Planctomycetota bacterium]|jgi:gamma-glutamylcyclotransferase (GGCT)/AIG2-like uncharacterized protein YtfP
MSEHLFVYGLLRAGQAHGHVLDGLARTGPYELEGFVLYNLGRYPGAVRGPGRIVGNLCEIPSPALWVTLDEVEGVHHRPPLYSRERVVVSGIAAWIYVYDRPVGDAPRIRSGDWLTRDH